MRVVDTREAPRSHRAGRSPWILGARAGRLRWDAAERIDYQSFTTTGRGCDRAPHGRCAPCGRLAFVLCSFVSRPVLVCVAALALCACGGGGGGGSVPAPLSTPSPQPTASPTPPVIAPGTSFVSAPATVLLAADTQLALPYGGDFPAAPTIELSALDAPFGPGRELHGGREQRSARRHSGARSRALARRAAGDRIAAEHAAVRAQRRQQRQRFAHQRTQVSLHAAAARAGRGRAVLAGAVRREQQRVGLAVRFRRAGHAGRQRRLVRRRPADPVPGRLAHDRDALRASGRRRAAHPAAAALAVTLRETDRHAVGRAFGRTEPGTDLVRRLPARRRRPLRRRVRCCSGRRR